MSDHRSDERVVVGGTANLARFGDGFDVSIQPLLEALEEHVVLLKLLGEATSPSTLTVRIGHEVPYEGLASTSVVATGYGPGRRGAGHPGRLGPTRMDYPGAMASVRAVAQYRPGSSTKDDCRQTSNRSGATSDPYEILGVPRDADADTIKKAYRKLARQLHPDVNPDPETQEQFKEVTRAYEMLSDPEKRRTYDLGGDAFRRAGGFGAGAGAGFSFTDIMDAFFGGAGRWRGRAGRGPRPRVRRGQDALIHLDVDLAEAAFGTTRELKVDTAVLCTACQGERRRPGLAAR